MRFLFFVIMILLLHDNAEAQTFSKDSLIDDSTIDTLIQKTAEIDSLTENTSTKKRRNRKSEKVKEFNGPLSMFSGNPGRAALYSLICPGAGQYYNKKYWKIPVVLAAEGIAIGILVYNQRQYNGWLDRLKLAEENGGVDLEGRPIESIFNVTNQAWNQRNYSIIALAGIHLIQVAEAFVNRHLIEFDVSDNLSINCMSEGVIGVGLAFNLN